MNAVLKPQSDIAAMMQGMGRRARAGGVGEADEREVGGVGGWAGAGVGVVPNVRVQTRMPG